MGASVTPMPALGRHHGSDPRDLARPPRPASLPPWQGLFFARHPLWVPCAEAGGLGSPGQGGRERGGKRGGSALPGSLLSRHLLLPGYRGNVLNAALKIQNTDSSLPPGPGLPPSLLSSSGA